MTAGMIMPGTNVHRDGKQQAEHGGSPHTGKARCLAPNPRLREGKSHNWSGKISWFSLFGTLEFSGQARVSFL